MVICSVVNCSNRTDRGNVEKKSFYSFPTVIRNQCPRTLELSKERRASWIAAVKRSDLALDDDQKIKNTAVCSEHFIQGRPAKLFDQNNPDWIPSLKLGYEKTSQPDHVSAVSRHSRLQERARKRVRLDDDMEQLNSVECAESLFVDAACQTDLMITDIDRLENECQRLTSEVFDLKDQSQVDTYDQNAFKDNDEKVKFYTGLTNFCILLNVFKLISKSFDQSARNKLSLFQEYIIFLIRLKLNLSVQDLAYRFNVSSSTISRIFDKWLEMAYLRLYKIIVWPEREQLWETMPIIFKKAFGNRVSVIVDCFEIFINRPSGLSTRAMTWSNYKHHNTIKYLIGISPQGVITYISLGWGGRASDKHITENCGILHYLLPHDLVLADRGFDIAESCGLVCAELVTPAFTKGKKQLSAKEVQNTRKIANLRIHVERIIGLTRNKYHILQSILPIDYLKKKFANGTTTADRIVRVCCALTNLSNPIVPFD